ncbi:MAG: acyl-CoA dehydrogenase [Acidimicrobiia bacterium]|jgi:alkylation response protein AidB-like acyl-CoA dehydrogenase
MPIGITEDHHALHEAVRGWVQRHCPPSVPRALLDADAEARPPFWEGLAAQGWLGLHVPEADGGSGYGIPELVVVLEELGAAGAPGPVLATTLAAAIVAASTNDALRAEVLPSLAAGERIGAVAVPSASALSGTVEEGALRVQGTARPVLSAHLADVVVAPVATGSESPYTWVVLEVGDGVTATELASLDPTRRVAELTVDTVVPAARVLTGVDGQYVRDVAAVVMSADLVGLAQWCVDTSAAYAKDRVQFGRPIGQFQAVKHKCADMLCRVELARAAAWDASRAVTDAATRTLTAASAAALALDAAFENAKDCVQIHGGIGFTWEHDAHVYLRRSMAMRALAGEPTVWRARAAERALAGDRRPMSVDLGPEGDAIRTELRAFLAEVKDLGPAEQRRRVADAGYLSPTWPPPWGRAARAVEQIVIEEEFRNAKVPRPSIVIGAWALPPVIMYGTEEQQQRWIPPTLHGDITWCQLFSEPGAGSDLAALSTRAARVEGGWVLSGQKVWTSMAKQADWGILLARTNPDAPKHDGISCFMLDMKSPGIDIRPLRELTGDAFFNEVFFDDVFVPDDCLVGAEHDGWRAARTTLANERVFMGGSQTLGHSLEQVLELVVAGDHTADPRVLDDLGSLVVSAHALSCLGYRLTLAALAGADPSGSEAAVRKLLGVLQDQKVMEIGLHLSGPEGTVAGGAAEMWSRGFLFNRNLTIAGGTSEIQRNIIGERVLGLPRDP